MIQSIDHSAGTQSIQAAAVRSRTDINSGSAPTSPPTSARSRAQSNVDRLFALTAGISQKLEGTLNSAEAKRIQGLDGVSPDRVVQSLGEIKEKVDAMRARAPTLTRFTDKLSAEVDQAVKGGRGSIDRIADTVKQAQAAMAERYGYVGHLVDMKA